ncbi:MAG: o-succinylbenzoate synthase [Leptolyngbyaceae bacterium]|nr:o-succinylbenzoate synthase [Leptolyngbyaceae bacterium]
MEWIDLLNRSIPSSVYQVNYRPYQWPFRVPLQTRYGFWPERQGMIVQVVDQQGRVGFGDIAPLPWFGSESLAQALAWCKTLHTRSAASGITGEQLLAMPDSYPACQFGIESALATLLVSEMTQTSAPHCYLLPTGAIALQSWQQPWQGGTRTFKWKIGVAPVTEELGWFQPLLQILPPTATLRLDANGGLDWDTACYWLEACDRLTSPNHATIEFLEQPLPPAQFADLLALSHRFQTAIALDESVATLQQLQACYEQGWRGIVVIKAAIAGSPRQLIQFCRQYQLEVVWSSVFETAIARQFILNYMVPALPNSSRALGFGVEQWLPIDHPTASPAPDIWHQLPPIA